MTPLQFVTSDRGVGAFIAVLGAAIAWTASGYGIGTLHVPGAGLFPFAVGSIMTIVGLLIMASNRVKPTMNRLGNLRAIILVSFALLTWAWMIGPFGLLPATASLVFLACLASPPLRMRPLLLSVILVPLLGVVVFIKLLNLPLDIIK